MAGSVFSQIRKALSTLNPAEVREIAERPARIILHANSEQSFREMEEFFAPLTLSDRRRERIFQSLYRAGDPLAPVTAEIEVFEQGIIHPGNGFTYYPYDAAGSVQDILSARPELDLALARTYAPFREPVISSTIGSISTANGWFSVMTALPNVVPSPLLVPWAVGEFASDSAVLTANQIRMVFLIAAASGHPVGFQEQRSQIASIIAAAFGWRAIAREAVGKIPFGGGIIPKAAIAYAGTWVIGKSFERFYRIGYGYTDSERKSAFREAFERGKCILSTLLQKHREQTARGTTQEDDLASKIVIGRER
ncbi:MAG: hypothetical protein LC114_07465 [Bryobacterales bacterium]|nr:hypothetical protein [Bryobacterales bacterium]